MKGIILAGGTGSRLRPVTFVVNKNILPVYNKPSIFYSVELLQEANIHDICIVADYHHVEDFKTILGNGTDFGVKIHYESDTPYKKGPASALYYAKDYVDGDQIAVVFADGVYDTNISEEVKSFEKGAISFVKEVSNPQRYGIVEFDEDMKITSYEEKPENPKSNYAFTGLSIYDERVFEYIEMIQPGIDGEYYTTDVGKIYMENDELYAKEIKGFWQDIGTFDGLLRASNHWYKKNNPDKDCPGNEKTTS